MKNTNIGLQKLLAGTVTVLPAGELEKKLASGKKLRIKFGADPTAPDLHIGHAVVLSKLRQFQEMGHEIIFLIGDFTARIGDPTGKSKTRPPLSEEEIAHNTTTYFEQVSRILDPVNMTIRYNSEWLGNMTSKEWVKLCAHVTLARVIERDDFAKRMASKQPIGFHELLYPLLQGYDSVELKADVELGGTDQTFNLIMGRHLQEQYGQEGQVVITTPLLEGLDGSAKMSKSLGNTIGFTDTPQDVFGKIMSISDTLMWRYYRLLLYLTKEEERHLLSEIASGQAHVMDVKKNLAYRILQRFWGNDAAEEGKASFEHLFQKKDFEHAQEVFLEPAGHPVWIVDLLKGLGAVTGSSEARRLITEGAVSINGEKVVDFKAQVAPADGMQIKVGKRRFYRISAQKKAN